MFVNLESSKFPKHSAKNYNIKNIILLDFPGNSNGGATHNDPVGVDQ